MPELKASSPEVVQLSKEIISFIKNKKVSFRVAELAMFKARYDLGSMQNALLINTTLPQDETTETGTALVSL